MAEELRMQTIAIRTDPLEGAQAQTIARWEDVLTFLRQLESVAQSGKKFRLVEAKGRISYTVGK